MKASSMLSPVLYLTEMFVDLFSQSIFGSASISFPLVGFPHCAVMCPIVPHASCMSSPFPILFHDGCQQIGDSMLPC